MNYLIVATKSNIWPTIAGNERPAHDYNNHIVERWADILSICELYQVQPLRAAGSIIKNCSAQRSTPNLNTGAGCLGECYRIMNKFMRDQGFTMHGYRFSAIPIVSYDDISVAERIPTADAIAAIPQFTYDLVISSKYIHACMFVHILPGVEVIHQICGTSSRNKPTHDADGYRDVQKGDIIEFQYSHASSTIYDSWTHAPYVTRFLLVTNRKTGSFSYRELYGFNKTTFDYDHMSELDENAKRLTKGNIYYWDIFYRKYYWQDRFIITNIIKP